jgi:hypothetical protein
VTEGQLKLAEGQVRCGACLRVFSAPQHEVSSFKPEQNSPADEHLETSIKAVNEPSKARPDTTSASTDIPIAAAEPVKAPPPVGIDADQARAGSTAALPLIAEPLQLAKVEDERNPITTAFLLLGILLTLAVFLSQLIWFERARLAQYPQLQSIYSMLCHQISCDLDSAHALSQIRNHSLHVHLTHASPMHLKFPSYSKTWPPFPSHGRRFSCALQT